MEEKSDSWFGSFLNAAKNKGTEVLEFVKKDLEEFGTVVKNEASSVVSAAGSVVDKTLNLDSPDSTASTVKRSFSSFLGQMNTVLNPSPDDSDAEAILILENSETAPLTTLQKAIYTLQKNSDTFLSDPDPSLLKQYQCWLEISEEQLSDDRIAKYVNSSEVLKRQYAKLVPEVVEHGLFWKRYLFKKALIEDEIAREEALNKKEEKNVVEDKLKWEQEDFAADIELTEEQQIKLLEQYEKETKERKNSPESKRLKEASPKKEEDNDRSDGNKKQTFKKESSAGLDSPSSSSIDEDWEKISDTEK